MGLVPYTILIILSIICISLSMWGSFEGQILSHKSLIKSVKQKITEYNLAAAQAITYTYPAKQTKESSQDQVIRKQHPIKGKIFLPALFRDQNSAEGKLFLKRLIKQVYASFLTEKEIGQVEALIESFSQVDWKKGHVQWKDLCPKEDHLISLFYILLKGSCLDPLEEPLKAPSLERLLSLRSSSFFFSLSEVDYAILEIYFENPSKMEKIRLWEQSNKKLVTRQDLYQIVGQDSSFQSKMKNLR